MRFFTLYLVIAAVLPVLVASKKPCFYPDGKNATSLTPCNPDADVSHCCRDGDVCLKNGYCFSAGLNSILRRGCTDSTWKSASCPSACFTEPYRSGDAVLTACGQYNSFCCGQDKTARSCCDSGNASLAVQVPGAGLGITIGGDMSDSGCPITTDSYTSLKAGRNALIAVTVVFVVALLTVAALALRWRRSWRQRKTEYRDLEQDNTRLRNEHAEKEQQNQDLQQQVRAQEEKLINMPAMVRTALAPPNNI